MQKHKNPHPAHWTGLQRYPVLNLRTRSEDEALFPYIKQSLEALHPWGERRMWGRQLPLPKNNFCRNSPETP